MKKELSRRSGVQIAAELMKLLGGRLSAVMLLAVLNGSLGFLCAMGVPFFGAVGIAKALGESIPLTYGAIAGLCVGCGVLRGGLRYLEQYGNHYIAFRLLAVLRDKIFTKLRALCPAKLESRQKGSLLTMITADIETLEVFYAHTVSPVCIAVLVSAAVMVVTGLAASWYLSLIAAAAYLCIGVLLPRFFSRRMAETGMRYRRELGDFGAYFLDSIKGIRELVLYNAGETRAAEVGRRSDAMLGRTKALKRETALSAAATEAAVSLSVLAVLAVGIFLVHIGSLSVGRMVLGVTAVFGSFGPVIAVSALPANLNQTFASGERILRLLEEQPEVEAVENGTELSCEGLEVHDLSFAYGGEAVLKGVSMTARKNEIVGIVGESGCGKSTLLKLLLRFWERSGGQIRYNGTDIDEINTESLYRNVTMVSQSTYLFDATIAENLRVAKPDATDEELMAALRMASAEELVQALPEGLNTPAGLLGERLSMGERQRIGLARAFLSGCPLILLDEPTSNVDSINEGVILRALLKHKQGQDDHSGIPPRVYHGGGGQGIQNGKRTNGGASNMNRRYLQKFQIKDVVFLAIMSAVALATCAVMPLVISLQPLIFGISQLVTALQIGVFFAIGLYKVRKPGSLLIMALMMGLIQLMMSPPMFLSSVLNGVLIELIVLLLFRGYERDAAVFVAAMLHTPLSLPFNYLYNRIIKGADSPLAAVADGAPLAAVGMTLAVVAVSALGALIGIKIARELKKSGVLKK